MSHTYSKSYPTLIESMSYYGIVLFFYKNIFAFMQYQQSGMTSLYKLQTPWMYWNCVHTNNEKFYIFYYLLLIMLYWFFTTSILFMENINR